MKSPMWLIIWVEATAPSRIWRGAPLNGKQEDLHTQTGKERAREEEGDGRDGVLHTLNEDFTEHFIHRGHLLVQSNGLLVLVWNGHDVVLVLQEHTAEGELHFIETLHVSTVVQARERLPVGIGPE